MAKSQTILLRGVAGELLEGSVAMLFNPEVRAHVVRSGLARCTLKRYRLFGAGPELERRLVTPVTHPPVLPKQYRCSAARRVPAGIRPCAGRYKAGSGRGGRGGGVVSQAPIPWVVFSARVVRKCLSALEKLACQPQSLLLLT